MSVDTEDFASIVVTTYVAAQPLDYRKAACAFMSRLVDEVDANRKKTGRKVYDELPMVFYGETEAVAAAKARAFWEDETAKAKAKADRAKALGSSRKKVAA